METLYHNRTRKEQLERELGTTYCELDELLTKSDYVLLMASSNSETIHLMGKEQFALMKKSAIFINGSRGINVDEKALVQALKEQKLLGAALDVYQTEPIDVDPDLLQFENVITVPHIGSATFETRKKMIGLAITNLIQGLYNQVPLNLLNKEVLEKN